MNKTEEAEGAFRRAIELREDWTPPIAALGSLLVGKSQYDEARRLLSKALLDEPRNPVALAALTELFLKTNVDETTLRGLLDRLTQATTSVRPTANFTQRESFRSITPRRSARCFAKCRARFIY